MHPAVDRYEQAYATEDDGEVERLVAEAFSPGAVLESVYLDQPVVGREALVDHIRSTRARLVGTRSVRTSPVERVGKTLRWTWAFEADGQTVAEGTDFALLDDEGVIERLVVSDGRIPPP